MRLFLVDQMWITCRRVGLGSALLGYVQQGGLQRDSAGTGGVLLGT